jgi:hypothetical protein
MGQYQISSSCQGDGKLQTGWETNDATSAAVVWMFTKIPETLGHG